MGTIRSISCNPVTPTRNDHNGNMLCFPCTRVQKLDTFRGHVKRSSKSTSEASTPSSKTNNRWLSPDALLAKHGSTREKKKTHKRRNIRTDIQKARLRKSVDPEHWDKKMITGICKKLREVAQRDKQVDGGLAGEARVKVMADILQNLFTKDKHAKRHGESTMYLAKIVRLVGSPKVYNILAANLGWPHIRTVDKAWSAGAFEVGLVEENWERLAGVYTDIMERQGIKPGSVISELPADETRITPKPEYCARTDKTIGYCGEECE
jgi:hypothetical protein